MISNTTRSRCYILHPPDVTGRVGRLSPRFGRDGEAGRQSTGWEQKVLHILRTDLTETDAVKMIEDTDSANMNLFELGDFVMLCSKLDPFLSSCEAVLVKAVVAVFNYVGIFVSWFIESSIPNFITLHCKNNSLLVKSRICECEIATG